ncbi:MAG: putative IclR family transcriptional regulator [Gemmatimonadetes bacterium]|nr:putative IclR family transcriptional regulator [Gemmatimonadota bacterium]
MPKVASAPYPGTQAVRRAFSVLKAFDSVHPEWSVSDLSRHIGLHKTTTFRLLGALVHEGMLEREETSGTYRLGPELIALGSQALRSTDLYNASHAELEAVARDTGEAATIEILVGDEVVILDEVRGRYLVGGRPDFGLRFPAHATSTGKLLLAAERGENATAKRAKKGRLAKLTSKTITDPDELEKELAKVTRQGFATAIDEIEEGFAAVGAPIRDFGGRTVAAMSVGGARVRFTRARITELTARVREAADLVSRRLGYTPKG